MTRGIEIHRGAWQAGKKDCEVSGIRVREGQGRIVKTAAKKATKKAAKKKGKSSGSAQGKGPGDLKALREQVG